MTMLSREKFRPFFEQIDRLDFLEAAVSEKHKGVAGLYRLCREIRQTRRIDMVIDLHDVLRSRILSFLFRLAGFPVYRINKGRKEKRRLTAKKGKKLIPLTVTVNRYLNVFARAGFPAALSRRQNWFSHITFPQSFLQEAHLLPKAAAWIGIAPFARHREKTWPIEKTEALIAEFDPKNTLLFLFGGGGKEKAVLNQLKAKYKDIIVVAGALTLTEELGLMSRLDAMISMDSANMHLAALCGTPVISIWGATHPYAGFAPAGDNAELMVQIGPERLACRPCSVFGNKPCWRGDHACMEWITTGDVMGKVTRALEKRQ
jgi:ADP-heptose:LPS heptosyltransferase